jgi:phosphatidylglycerophosphate synthase
MTPPRRELASRRTRWAASLAVFLAKSGVRPNMVSVAGLGFAALAGLAFTLAPSLDRETRAAVLVAAALGIQLRLLCNLLDGMLAVEHGLKSNAGEIYNEIPDRIADIVILIGAGYAVRELRYGVTLGWAAALAAVLTAYIRVFGGSIGAVQQFSGPMAKQHRMFTLTVATFAAAGEVLAGAPARAIPAGLAVIAAGSIVTAIRRTMRIVAEVNAR